MRIIEQKKWWVLVCRNCKSKLEAEPSDVRVAFEGANYGGDTPDRIYVVPCPHCGEKHKVSERKLTSRMISEADALYGAERRARQ